MKTNAVAIILALAGNTLASAGTHPMVWVGGATSWSGTVTVTGGQLTAEKANFQEDELGWVRPMALYTIKKTAQVRLQVAYTGPGLLESTVKINGQPGSEITTTITLEPGQKEIAGSSLIHVTAQALIENDQGEPIISDFETFLLMETRFYRLLDVEMNNTSGSFERSLTSYKITPRIVQAGNYDKIHLDKVNWGDVGVQIEPKGVIGVNPADWQRTDEHGYAKVRLYAATEEFSEQLLGGLFTIRAVKDGCTMEDEKSNFIPYAIVRSARNTWFLGGSGEIGDITEPVLPPMTLKPGDLMQIGTRLVSGDLEVDFCNQQKATLQADNYEGFRATVGAGDLIAGKPLIWLDLKGMAQDLKDNPRRCLRMAIYKGLGNAVDATIGTPDAVGWVAETPGGKVEKWLADWGERAYQQPPAPPRPSGAGPILSEGDVPEPLMQTAAKTSFEFYTDGTMWVENAGSPVAVRSEAGQQRKLTLGGATFIKAEANDQQVASPEATSTTAWEALPAGNWTLTPAHGQTLTTNTPLLSIHNSHPERCLWETLVIRLNGYDITSWFAASLSSAGEAGHIQAKVDPMRALANGQHTLSYRVATTDGELAQGSADFTVTAPVPAPAASQGFAFSAGVWLTWEKVPTAVEYQVWRASTTNGAAATINTNALTQPGFLDRDPLPHNCYWVEAVDGAGQRSARQRVVETDWNSSLPDAPDISALASNSVILADVPTGIKITFDAQDRDRTRWKLARSTQPTSGFTPVLEQEDTVEGEFLDQDVSAGVAYYYRLTAYRLDESSSNAMVAGPILRSTTPSRPRGLSAHATGTSAIVNWDPYFDPRAESLTVWRDGGAGFIAAGVHPSTARTAVLPGWGNSVNRYYLRATGAETSGPSIAVGTGHIQRPAAPATITASDLRVFEGDGQVIVPLHRQGNLREPAVLFYQIWPGGQALPDMDFVKMAGSLVFAPGQTTAELRIPILPDAMEEWAEEFFLRITAPLGASDTYANIRITIDDSDLLYFADSVSEIAVNEDAGVATISIERAWPSQRTVAVTLIPVAEASSAISGIDYHNPTSWVVGFAPGQIRQTLNIPLINNAIKEGWRELHLRLTNATGGAAISESFAELNLRIRDDETHPGQFTPDAAPGRILVAPPGQDSVTVTLKRTDGTDGDIEAFLMIEGGTIPWGGVSLSSGFLHVSEGQTQRTVQLTLNRSLAPTNMAPFTMLKVFNLEYPNTEQALTVVFPPATAANFNAWAGAQGWPSLADWRQDPDLDGVSNLVELAHGSHPLNRNSKPQWNYAVEPGQLTLQPEIHPAPRLVVLAEFSPDLNWSQPQVTAGHWEWEPTNQSYQVEFRQWPTQSPASFGRLRYIWLED